jgi:hypothetical protein
MVVHDVAMILCKERADLAACAWHHFGAMVGRKAEKSL